MHLNTRQRKRLRELLCRYLTEADWRLLVQDLDLALRIIPEQTLELRWHELIHEADCQGITGAFLGACLERARSLADEPLVQHLLRASSNSAKRSASAWPATSPGPVADPASTPLGTTGTTSFTHLTPRSPDLLRPPAMLALVIEDDPYYQQHIADILSSTGLEVRIARSRRQAIDLVGEQCYAIVTLDMQLEVGDSFGQEGLIVLDLLKRYQPRTPIVMITRLSWDKHKTREFFRTYGIKDMLDKPFRAAELMALVYEYAVTGKVE